MNALLQHVALPTPSPPRRTTKTRSAPITIRSPKPLRAQGRGFGFGSGSGSGAGAGISDAKKSENKIKKQDDKDEDDDEDDEIPQAVFDRIMRRIAAAVGAPMAAGVGTVWALQLLKRGGVWAAPAWAPFVAALLGFGTSAFGIAYGALSASWDPEREGSPLGWEEARRNWPRLWKDEDEDETRKRRRR